MVVNSNGSVTGGTYGDLATNIYTPFTGVYTTASNYGAFDTPGTVIASFPSGHALVSALPTDATWAAKPSSLAVSNASLAAQTINSNPELAPLGADIWTTLFVDGETLPGVQLFGVPTYPGDIANLHYTGADIAAVSASDPIRAAQETAIALGEYQDPWSSRMTPVFPAHTGSYISGSGSAAIVPPPMLAAAASLPAPAGSPFIGSAAGCTLCRGW